MVNMIAETYLVSTLQSLESKLTSHVHLGKGGAPGRACSREFLDCIINDFRVIRDAIIFRRRYISLDRVKDALHVVLLECARLQSSAELFSSRDVATKYLHTIHKFINGIEAVLEAYKDVNSWAEGVRRSKMLKLYMRLPPINRHILSRPGTWSRFLASGTAYTNTVAEMRSLTGFETVEAVQTVPAAARHILDLREGEATDILEHLRLVCNSLLH